jgi:RNA polymerase sigma factor (sigma-70 family)
MARLRQGDHGGFDELWHRYRQPLFTFLLRRTGSLATAEDALQQTFVRMFRFRASYDASRPFRRWLYGIAANAGRDAFSAQPEQWDPLPETAAGGPDPERGAHVRDLLVRTLHELEGTDRRVLLLTIEGFTSTEIGEMLSMNQNTVRVRLKRARDRIKLSLEVGHG